MGNTTPCCGNTANVHLVHLEPSRPEYEQFGPEQGMLITTAEDTSKFTLDLSAPRDVPDHSTSRGISPLRWYRTTESVEGFLNTCRATADPLVRGPGGDEKEAAVVDTQCSRGTASLLGIGASSWGPNCSCGAGDVARREADDKAVSPMHVDEDMTPQLPASSAAISPTQKEEIPPDCTIDNAPPPPQRSMSPRSLRKQALADPPKKGKKAREAERLAKENGGDSGRRNDGAAIFRETSREPGQTDNLFNTLSSNMSNLSLTPFSTVDYEDMPKDQRREARELIKEFVKAMVRGRHLSAVTASGDIRTCFVVLARHLDRLKISFGEDSQKVREVKLSSITEIVVDENPADELLITLVLDNEQSITFRAKTIEERDKLAACLTMLIGQAKQPDASKRHTR